MEWGGIITAIVSTMLIAFNIGAELIGFSLLFISAFLIALWSYKKNKGILLLQLFYVTASILGLIRWFNLYYLL